MRVKMANLFAGLGGNRLKIPAHVEVTAIEMDPKISAVYQRQFPDDIVINTDAHAYLLEHYAEFDFIWSSPPCQANSSMIISGQNRTPQYPDLRLYEEHIFLETHFQGQFCIENVQPYYKPLIPGYLLGRHMFWSNFQITPMQSLPEMPGFINMANLAGKKALQDWLGIHYEENIYYGNNHDYCQPLRNACHPDIGLHIFECMNASKKDLFSEL